MTFPLKSLANRSLKINGERVPPRRNGASDPIAEARPRIQCFHLCLRSSLPPRNQHPSIILRIWTECGYTLPAVRIENVGSSDCRASPVSTGPQIIFLWKWNFFGQFVDPGRCHSYAPPYVDGIWSVRPSPRDESNRKMDSN